MPDGPTTICITPLSFCGQGPDSTVVLEWEHGTDVTVLTLTDTDNVWPVTVHLTAAERTMVARALAHYDSTHRSSGPMPETDVYADDYCNACRGEHDSHHHHHHQGA